MVPNLPSIRWLNPFPGPSSSDVLEDMRVNVRLEGSDQVVWYKASAAGVRIQCIGAVKLNLHCEGKIPV